MREVSDPPAMLLSAVAQFEDRVFTLYEVAECDDGGMIAGLVDRSTHDAADTETALMVDAGEEASADGADEPFQLRTPSGRYGRVWRRWMPSHAARWSDTHSPPQA